MRVIISGSRSWTDEDPIQSRLEALPKDTVIVHGAARGADQIADRWAYLLGLERDPHPADWKKHGKAAGPIRNREMLDAGADLVIAFWDIDNPKSKGTLDMIREAQRRGITTEICTP